MYRRTIATLAWLVWFMMLRSEAPAAAPGREVDPVAAVGLTVVRGLRLLDTPCAFGHVLELNNELSHQDQRRVYAAQTFGSWTLKPMDVLPSASMVIGRSTE